MRNKSVNEMSNCFYFELIVPRGIWINLLAEGTVFLFVHYYESKWYTSARRVYVNTDSTVIITFIKVVFTSMFY